MRSAEDKALTVHLLGLFEPHHVENGGGDVGKAALTQLVAIVEGEVDKDGVNAAMKAAASDSFGYTEDEIVSSDIIGITYGSLFDATQTKCMPMGDGTTLVKVVSWYDNENSYTSQMVRTIKYFAELK